MKTKSIIPLFLLYLTTCFGIQEESCCPPCLPRCQEVECIPCPDLYQIGRPTVFTNFEFLYWQVLEGALDYAFRMTRPTWGPTSSYVQGREKRAKFKYQPGFRASIGYFNAPKYYEGWIQYTWLYDKGSNSATQPTVPGASLLSTFPTQFTVPIAQATSHVDFHYHVIDLLADRIFVPNPHLRVRVFGGIPLTYQKQKWEVTYTNTEGNTSTVQNRWRFYGGGLKIGTNLDWYWGPHIYMTALFSSGLVLGNYHNQVIGKTTAIPAPGDNPDVAYMDGLRKEPRLAYTVQCLLGPSYQQNFCKFRMEIFAGYEFNAWFNLQEIYRSTQLTSAGIAAALGFTQTIQETGLLALQGLTARLTLDF